MTVADSFRDPDGFLFRSGDQVLRCVFTHAAREIQDFLESPLAIDWMKDRSLARTTFPDNASVPARLRSQASPDSLWLEHEVIWFPNYPYEWPPEMLAAAARLTLDMARAAGSQGFLLKDATPYNLMFDGPRPVFLDILSFRRSDPLECVWLPYAQFVRTFVYPLLASRHFGLRTDEILLTNRDGLEPDRLLALCPLYRRLLPPFLGAVTIPALLDGRSKHPGAVRRAGDAEEASFVLGRLFDRLAKLVNGRPLRSRRRTWMNYLKSDCPYTAAEFAEKEQFVAGAMENLRPLRVLDIGCNTGHFARVAARLGARVVAVDRDPDVTGELWRMASEEQLAILPLTIDIARPPGACGWANAECDSFLQRARGQFDCVLLLALVHHLAVNERVPLAKIFELAAELTTRHAIIEYIDPGDSQFQAIARGRDALHRDLTHESFERSACGLFDIVEARDISPTRRIYVLRKRGL